ncbi:MAG: ribonuclease J [Bacillota bacterium]
MVLDKTAKNSNSKSNKNAVKIHFLGGIGEIGKNCTALECGEDIIVIDGGMSFPTEEMPGIDVVLPDTTFLQQNKDRVRGFVITHGHEDHIGALPYILKDVNAPLYATKLTFAILENKFKEKNVVAKQNVIAGGSVITLGKFKVEFIHVNHSIPGSVALAITTPQGVIFHTGDFKIDFSPVDGEVMDLARIAEIGKKGVQLLMADSTNSEKEGYVMSESTVGSSLLRLFEENEGKRIIVATFASNVHRVQQIIDVAKRTKRKVALSGRSMINVVDAAMRIGAIKADENTFVDIDKIDKLFDRELVIISTGSQGEPMSALARMASGDFNKVKITNNDAVIISASPIPGNEKGVYRVVNRLMKLGADVIYSKLHEIHVSGHAAREELKIIHELVKPKLFIPVHGEYRHLMSHKNLAIKQGMHESKILVPELGDTIEITKNAAKRVGQIPHGAVLVDGLGFGDMDSLMLKDRKLMSEEGVMIVVVAINTITGELLDDPEIVIRGIVLNSSKDKILLDAKKLILQIIKAHDLKDESSRQELKFEIRKKLRNFFIKIKQRPMILPIVIEAKKDISISRDDYRIDGM